MADFNPNALSHPCMSCIHGRSWTEQQKPAGNYCLHPDITRRPGLYYGRFHNLRTIPKWCPLKEVETKGVT